MRRRVAYFLVDTICRRVGQRAFIFAALLFISLHSIATAQVATRLLPNALEQVTGESAQAEVSDVVPDVFDLRAGWWHYFNDKTTIEERSQSFLSELDRLATEVGERGEDATVLKQQLDLIRASMLGYVATMVAAPEQSESVETHSFQKSYTPTEVIRVVQQRRQLTLQQAEIQDEIAAAERSRASVKTRLDNRFAAYLQSSEQGTQRLIDAFRVIADRFTLLITDARIQTRKQELTALEQHDSRYQEEITFAELNLVSTAEAIAAAQETIKEKETLFEQAKEAVVQTQAKASEISGSTLLEQSERKLLAQQVVNAEVSANLSETELIRWQEDYQLLLLLDKKLSPSDAREKNNLSQQRLAEMVPQINRLAKETTAEEELVYRSVTGADVLADDAAERQRQQLEELRQRRIEATKAAQLAIGDFYEMQASVEELVNLTQSEIFRQEGAFQNVGEKAVRFLGKAKDFITSSFNKSLFRIGETPVTPRGILIALSILVIGWILSWLLRRFLNSLTKEGEHSHSVYYTIGRLSHYLIILLSILLGLSLLGISLTSFAVVAGALAIGIGFGLQAIVNNFISGLILLFERSLKVGDFIEFSGSGLQGEVKAINVRSTQIKTNDNIDIIVPNSEFINTKVVNWTLYEAYRRMIYDFKVGFDADKKVVREAVIKAASELPHTLTGIPGKGPQVWLSGYGEYAYHMQLAVWLKPASVKRPQVVNAAYFWAIDDALEAAGIRLPLPQREISIRNPEALGGIGISAVAPEQGADGAVETTN